MCKSEVQPPAPPELRVGDIVILLLLGHGIPNPFALPVAENVVCLCGQEEANSEDVDDHQRQVALVVQGTVVLDIYVGGNDTTDLAANLKMGKSVEVSSLELFSPSFFLSHRDTKGAFLHYTKPPTQNAWQRCWNS